MKDNEIMNGLHRRGTLFIVSDEGGVYRRRYDSAANDYAIVGRLAVNTADRRAAVLEALRKAHPERGTRRQFASRTESRRIVEQFNAEAKHEA